MAGEGRQTEVEAADDAPGGTAYTALSEDEAETDEEEVRVSA